jgi:hypothetical protein
MKDMKTIEFGKVFTEEQTDQMIAAYKKAKKNDSSVNQALFQIIEPLIPQINRVTSQKNDASYWAYIVEAAITRQEQGR